MKGFLRVRDKPSVYEVARLAGVSTATVSRVLAGYERVLPRTRDKVLTAVAELGYVPSGAARDLAARRTGVLGLCFPDLDTEDGDAAYWYDEVIRGMERAARRSGYAVLIAATHHRDDSGLVLPPAVAPYQVVIVPIGRDNWRETVLPTAKQIQAQLSAVGVRVTLDERDERPGWKFSEWEMRGVPVRVEIGPKDIEKSAVMIARRDTREKLSVPMD